MITVHRVPGDPSNPAAIAPIVDLRTAVLRETWGTSDLAIPLAVELAALRNDRYRQWEYLAASDGDRLVGAAFVDFPLRENVTAATVQVRVLPAERGRGVGAALYEAALERVREMGRSTVFTATPQRVEPPAGPAALAASTGSGRVARDAPGVRFALARGFSLEQVERRSVLQVPVPEGVLASSYDEAAAAAGADYRLVTWGTTTPDEWLDEHAALLGRMSTDAPTGGLDWGAQAWDGARVRAEESEAAAGGHRWLVTAAEHVPTGTLAAFTVLWVPSHTEEYVEQGDTLVVPEHRGRRLGMLVKAANLRRLAAERPAVRRVGTWNAEENRWMLAINVALGFCPSGGSGRWQLRLP